jgi:hypothetical protein
VRSMVGGGRLPPCAPLADWHKASAFQAEQAGSTPGTVRSMVVALWNVIGDRLVVGRLALDQKTEVRPLLPEPIPDEQCLVGNAMRSHLTAG